MTNVTAQQLAELLLGIARSQYAIIEAMENHKAGFKSTHFRPTLESTSRIRSNQTETLTDFPSRLLLQMLGRTGPDVARVTRELEVLLSRHTSIEVPGESTPAPAAAAGSLDMTQQP